MPDIQGDSIRLEKNDIPKAASMLTKAFFSDPKMTHLIPERGDRSDRSRFLFEFELRYGMIYGDVYTTSQEMEGVCVWLPSEKSEITVWRALRAGGMRLQKDLGKNVMDRLMAFSTLVDNLHKKHLKHSHYYLFFIGVDPLMQGKGYASRLVRPMLTWLDMKNLPCYLNTQNEKNISIYQHYGFHIIEQYPIPGSDIIHTAIQRDPIL